MKDQTRDVFRSEESLSVEWQDAGKPRLAEDNVLNLFPSEDTLADDDLPLFEPVPTAAEDSTASLASSAVPIRGFRFKLVAGVSVATAVIAVGVIGLPSLDRLPALAWMPTSSVTEEPLPARQPAGLADGADQEQTPPLQPLSTAEAVVSAKDRTERVAGEVVAPAAVAGEAIAPNAVERDVVDRETLARETLARETAARETAARETAAREAAAREAAGREAAAREATARRAVERREAPGTGAPRQVDVEPSRPVPATVEGVPMPTTVLRSTAPAMVAPLAAPPPSLSAATPSAPSAPPAASAPAASPAPPVTSVTEVNAIQDVLGRYRDAFSELDAGAARAVWPSVDARALGRAFDQLEQQDLQFDSCKISVTGVRAVASCGGSARYIPSVGNRSPRTEARQWTFALHKVNQRWLIEGVASRE